MQMDKKGFSLVELSISLVLIAIILFSMMNLLTSVKDFDVSSTDYTNNIISKEAVVKAINNDIVQNKLTSLEYDANDKNTLTINVGSSIKTIQIVNNGKTIIYYSLGNIANPIFSETLCSTCGKYKSISVNRESGNVNVGEVVKIIIEHSNKDYNCEITYYRAN